MTDEACREAVTCPCCGSGDVHEYRRRYPAITHWCKGCGCKWNESRRAAWTARAGRGDDELHAAIMNIPVREAAAVPAYRIGHRDARHAAADLVSAYLAHRSPSDREAALEEAADCCDKRAESLYASWRSMGRADSHLEGQADSADACATAIRALMVRP